MRAVETTPVHMPRSSACSRIVVSRFSGFAAATGSGPITFGAIESMPSLALLPVTIAVMVGAESGVCWLAW
jgi:hypothetical protein